MFGPIVKQNYSLADFRQSSTPTQSLFLLEKPSTELTRFLLPYLIDGGGFRDHLFHFRLNSFEMLELL